MKTQLIFALSLCLFLSFTSTASADIKDEGAILDTVTKAVEALNTKDQNTLKSLHLPNGQIYSVSSEDDAMTLHYSTHAQFLEQTASAPDAFHEQIWNPIVMYRETVATVWTDYRVTIDGALSHCGVNSFHLLKTDDGWRIASVDFSIRKTGCDN